MTDSTNLTAEDGVRQFLESDANPSDKAYHCLSIGQRMEMSANFEAAIACYSLAFGLTPEDDDVWYFLHNNLGFCLNRFGKHDDAAMYCRQAIQIDPERHNAFKNLGIALEGLGRYEDAAHHYAHAARLKPEDPRAFKHLEDLLDSHPDLPVGITDLRTDVFELYRQRGFIYCTAKEAKVTAVVYAQFDGVLEHIRANGRLPEMFDSTRAPAILTDVLESRGLEIELTPEEEMVHDAIVKGKRMRGGVAQLANPAAPLWHFFPLK